jgi:hypothetical protein
MDTSREALTVALANDFIEHVKQELEAVTDERNAEPSTAPEAYDAALRQIARRARNAESKDHKYIVRDANRLYDTILSVIENIPSVMVDPDTTDEARRGYKAAHTVACELRNTFHEQVSDPSLSLPR